MSKLTSRAHHQAGQVADGAVVDVVGAAGAPEAQHGHAVGDLLDLVELVADEQHREALGGQAADHVEQLARLLRGQHGRRLVQDQDARAAEQRLDDLHALPLAHGQLAHLFARVELHVVLACERLDLPGGGLEVEPHAAGVVRADEAVLHDAERRDQHEVLVHHADADGHGVLGGVEAHGLALDEDLAGGRLVQAAQHVHQRALARAVLAKERVHLPLLDRETDVRIGQHAGELLVDVLHFQDGCHQNAPFLNRACRACPAKRAPRRCAQTRPKR